MAKRFVLLILISVLFISAGMAEGEKSRLPGPVEMTVGQKIRILQNGSLTPSPVLDAALSLLEEGNPFLERYNLLTDSDIQPKLPYGVPYLYGGQAESHVFAKAPEYVVQEAWINSPIYYRAGTTYIYEVRMYSTSATGSFTIRLTSP